METPGWLHQLIELPFWRIFVAFVSGPFTVKPWILSQFLPGLVALFYHPLVHPLPSQVHLAPLDAGDGWRPCSQPIGQGGPGTAVTGTDRKWVVFSNEKGWFNIEQWGFRRSDGKMPRDWDGSKPTQDWGWNPASWLCQGEAERSAPIWTSATWVLNDSGRSSNQLFPKYLPIMVCQK